MNTAGRTAADETLSDSDLRTILARCDAATAGPWESFVEGRNNQSGNSFIQRGGLTDPVDDMYIQPWRAEDQDFIAAARQDVPRLIRELMRLRKQVGLK